MCSLCLNCSSPLFPDCKHPGQPRCYSQQEVGERSLLYEYAEHRSAGAEVSAIDYKSLITQVYLL